jgi:hypothetical protein
LLMMLGGMVAMWDKRYRGKTPRRKEEKFVC